MVYSFDLDMTPGGVPQIVRLSRYDKKIPELEFTLWNGASGYTIPTGATVFITGSKPDKTGFEYECIHTGSVVSVEVTEQMTAVAGRVVCELTVATSNGKKGSANFFLDVEPSALSDDTVISETDIPIIQHIPEIVAECEDYAETAHKWATFGNDSETPSSTNNALYWAQKAQEYAVGALHWKASVAFANIPTTGMEIGDMYNITDAFTTDARFDEGAGVKCSAGTNIVWDANSKWDILISSTNAADINFDNTGTGMTATNVQNAITELNTGKQASTDNNLTTTDKTVTGAINEINTSLSDKQDTTDNSLTTTDKTIPGAINELNSNLIALENSATSGKSTINPNNYSIPCDGYYEQASGVGANAITYIKASNGTQVATIMTDGSSISADSIFVKKGMIIQVYSASGTNSYSFSPLDL